MQIYFIRHGQSENNALWDRGGPRSERRTDPELTELGHKQAKHLVKFFSKHCLTHLYCSPMIRCIETGSYLSKALGLPLAVWEHAHELGGIFVEDPETGKQLGLPGNDRAYLRSRYQDLVMPKGWGVGGWWNRPFEEREQRILRAQRFHRELLRRHGESEDKVAVVSHAGFFNYWMMVALDWNNWEGKGFRKNNAAITRVDLGERTSVMYVNRTDFMPAALVS